MPHLDSLTITYHPVPKPIYDPVYQRLHPVIVLVLRALTHDIPITVCLPFVNPRLTIKRVRRGPKLTEYP